MIDYNRIGWSEKNESVIKKDYPEIHHVGVDPNPSADSSDEDIAVFCEEHNYDLITGDKRAYADLLKNNHVKAVQISLYGFDFYTYLSVLSDILLNCGNFLEIGMEERVKIQNVKSPKYLKCQKIIKNLCVLSAKGGSASGMMCSLWQKNKKGEI